MGIVKGDSWHLPQFKKKFEETFHNFHSNTRKFQIYAEETPFTIPKKMELYLDVFHNFLKIGFILKVSLQETLFTISIQTVENFKFMLNMSLEETPSTIPKKNRIILRRLS